MLPELLSEGFVRGPALRSLGHMPGSGIAGSYSKSLLNFLRSRLTISIETVRFYILTSGGRGLSFPTSWPAPAIFLVFFLVNIVAILVGVGVSRGFECAFQRRPHDEECGASLVSLLAVCPSSWEQHPVGVLRPFESWFVRLSVVGP